MKKKKKKEKNWPVVEISEQVFCGKKENKLTSCRYLQANLLWEKEKTWSVVRDFWAKNKKRKTWPVVEISEQIFCGQMAKNSTHSSTSSLATTTTSIASSSRLFYSYYYLLGNLAFPSFAFSDLGYSYFSFLLGISPFLLLLFLHIPFIWIQIRVFFLLPFLNILLLLPFWLCTSFFTPSQ